MRECIKFTKCNPDIWRKIIVREIILHFLKKEVYLVESDINFIGISRTKKGEKVKMFLAGAWVYLDGDSRCYLRIILKPKKFMTGLSITVEEGEKRPDALKILREIARARLFKVKDSF